MTTAEVEKGFQEIWDLFRETDKKFKETDRKFQETAKRFRETDKKFKETDRKFQETDKKFNDLAVSLAQTDRKIDQLAGKWGRFVEGMVAPAIERLFRERNIDVDTISLRVKRRKNGEQIEIDVLALNSEWAVLTEVKSTLKVEDVNEHLDCLSKFKSFFPEFIDRRVIGAVAGIVIDENADRYAYKKGLYVIAQSGETVKILNDVKFQPRVW